MFGKFFNANLKKRVFDTSNDHYFCVLYQKLFDDPILILRDNSVFSFNQESEHYTFFDYYQDLYVETYIDQVKKPHMIYTGIGNIPQLESMTLDKNTVEKLNQTGLNIYLYELLSFRYNVVDKFYIDPINYERSDNSAKDVFSEKASTENGFSYELDSIQQFVVNNRLTGVTVFTCEYFSRELFSDKYPEFKIKSKDIFVQSLFSEKSDPIRKNFNSDEIKYKFWLSNWRYTSFRNIVAAYVCQRSCLISWNYNISNENFLKEIWFDLNYKREKILKGNEYLNRHGPFTIDLPAKMSIQEEDKINRPTIKNSIAEPLINPETYQLPTDFYAQCFCAIITESRFTHPVGMFSEKTINAIKTMRPFVLVSPPRTLEYLRSLGFKTFDEFWDESYDLEVNHEKRIYKILDIIDHIDNFNLEDLKILYNKMLPILKHNLSLLEDFKKNTIEL